MHSLHDPFDTTLAARAAFLAKFMDEVDPSGELRKQRPEEALRRAESARKAYFARLAYLSIKARNKKSERSKKDADRVDALVGVEQEGHHHGSPAE